MNNNFFGYTIKKRKITICLIGLVIVMGLFSYAASPKQENPEVSPPVAAVTCVYPGASPSDVEKLVTIPIEKAMRDVEGYSYSNSTAKKNFSVTVLWLKSETDVDKSWRDLRAKLQDLEKTLPEECEPIDINTNLADSAGVMVSLTSNEALPIDLADYGKSVEKKLLNIDGVSRTEIIGMPEKSIEVLVDEKKLSYFNLSLDDLATVLSVQNMEIPSGFIDDGKGRITVNAPSGYTSLEDIENIVIDVSRDSGAVLRIKDVATVGWSVDKDSLKIKDNGTAGLLVTAYFDKNINVLTLDKKINEVISQESLKLPAYVSVNTILFQPDEIAKAVNNFMRNLICGVLLVMAVVWIGMSYRNAIVISTVIPLSILMTFVAMYLGKVAIHEISTAGLIIALGMLVDNAIVVSDAIQGRLDSGEDRLTSCIWGAKESALPILSATMTTIAAFLPLAMMSGVAGSYIYSVPFTVIAALIASYINAIFVIPVLAYMFFKPSNETKKDNLLKLRKVFDKLLDLGLANQKKTIAIAGILICFSVVLVMQIGLSFFPFADKDIMHIKITGETGSNVKKTEAAVLQVEEILKEHSEITNYTSSIGGGFPKFYVTLDKMGESPEVAQIMMRVNLKKSKEGVRDNTELAEILQEEIDESLIGAQAVIKQLEHAEPAEAPIKIRVHGEKMEDLQRVSKKLMAQLKETPGTINVRSDLRSKEYEYYVNVDRDTSSRLGITNYDIQRQLNIALSGLDASTYVDGKNDQYDIVVKSSIDSASSLLKLPIASSATGSKVYLGQMAAVELKAEYPKIERYEGERSITVFSDVEKGVSAVNIEKELEKFIKMSKEEGDGDLVKATISFDGEGEKINKYFGDAMRFAVLAVLLIFFIMMLQFYSFKQPLIVMATMPLAVVGSLIGLFIFRQSLSFTALLGMISLMGIIVNNAILLIDYINKAKESGMNYDAAIRNSVDRRFRPIMLSTITTVIGLAPLAVSGSALFMPMAIALMSGLTIATTLTLVFIPVLISLTRAKAEKSGEKPLLI